jgi:integrase
MPLKLKQRNGTWYIDGTINGQRVRQSTRTRDREAALRIAAEAEAKGQRIALYGADAEVTFADAALIYLQDGKPGRFLEPLIAKIGGVKLKQISAGEVRALAKRLYPTATPATWNRQALTPVQAVINHAAEYNLCSVIRVTRFKEADVARVACDWKWITAFRESAVNPHIAALCHFMFTTGARVSEALNVEVHEVDFEKAVIKLWQGKVGKWRDAYLTDSMALEIYQLEPKQVKNGEWRVFGYQQRHGSFYNHWRRSCERAGIAYVPPHQAGRHSFATELGVRKGVNPKVIAELGGWQSVRTVLDHYTHAEDLAEIVREGFARPAPKGEDKKIVRLKTRK